MIVVELRFTNPADERLAARPAHRARLEHLHSRGILYAAGPFADDSGALLVFAGDAAVVDGEIDADPYFRTPGVQIVSRRAWAPLVGSQLS